MILRRPAARDLEIRDCKLRIRQLRGRRRLAAGPAVTAAAVERRPGDLIADGAAQAPAFEHRLRGNRGFERRVPLRQVTLPGSARPPTSCLGDAEPSPDCALTSRNGVHCPGVAAAPKLGGSQESSDLGTIGHVKTSVPPCLSSVSRFTLSWKKVMTIGCSIRMPSL